MADRLTEVYGQLDEAKEKLQEVRSTLCLLAGPHSGWRRRAGEVGWAQRSQQPGFPHFLPTAPHSMDCHNVPS